MSTTTTELASYEDPAEITEWAAVAGFLAGYTGNARTGYTTDLRSYADWCHAERPTLLEVRRVELFARWMKVRAVASGPTDTSRDALEEPGPRGIGL